MDTISEASDSQRLLLSLGDKINLKRSHIFVTLSSFSIYCMHEKI